MAWIVALGGLGWQLAVTDTRGPPYDCGVRALSLPEFSTYRVPRRVRGLGHNVLIAAAVKQGARVRVLSRDPAIFEFRRGRRRIRIARLEFGLNAPLAKTICHRKEVARVFLGRARLPVPAGLFLRLTEDADPARRARSLGFPLVLKPPDSHGGQLAYPGIRSVAELKQRLRQYADLGVREVLAEREVKGRNYRMLVLDGRIIGLSERLPPTLVGDGRSSVRELVARRNALRRGNLPVLPVVLDTDARRALRRQGLTPSSVPRKGRRFLLHAVTNISKGGTCREVLELVHPGWRRVARRILRAIPGSRLLGADIIAHNIARSPFDAAQGKPARRWWIIEVNGNPEIELHHFPWEGIPSDPAAAIVRALFS